MRAFSTAEASRATSAARATTTSAGCETDTTARLTPAWVAAAAATAFNPAASHPSSTWATTTRPFTRAPAATSSRATCPASCSCRVRPLRLSILFSACSRSIAGASSPGDTDSARFVAESASRHSRTSARARPPQRNSTRVPPLNFSQPVTAITPMPPVRVTCVPPQADRSKSATSTSRSVPLRTDSLRKGSAAASSAETNRTRTSRSCHTTRLASSSATAISLGDTRRCRSIVADVVPRWKLSVRARHDVSNAADSTCCPVCCCM